MSRETLRPDLHATLHVPRSKRASSDPRQKVLFVCPSVGDRSLIAAALTTHLLGESLSSAWTSREPPAVHPYTLVVLSERGIRPDEGEYRKRPAPDAFDRVILLGGPDECHHDAAAEATSPPNRTTVAECWAFDDPACISPCPSLAHFRRLRDTLEWLVWQHLAGLGGR